MYSFECGDDIKNNLKCVSKSRTKRTKFQEEKNV